MENKLIKKENLKLLSKKKLAIATIAILVLAVIIVGIFMAMQPQRTVANFCSVAKEEKSVLTGDVNYQQRLNAYRKLEAVSPNDIQPDITAIRKGYEDIVNNPSDTLSVGLGIAGSENRRTAYVTANCPNF